MELSFQLVRGNAFSKLKKAISAGDVEKMVMSMLHLEFVTDENIRSSDARRSRRAGTRGAFIRRETMRAIKALRKGKASPAVLRALELAKEKIGPLWDQAIPAPTSETPAPASN